MRSLSLIFAVTLLAAAVTPSFARGKVEQISGDKKTTGTAGATTPKGAANGFSRGTLSGPQPNGRGPAPGGQNLNGAGTNPPNNGNSGDNG